MSVNVPAALMNGRTPSSLKKSRAAGAVTAPAASADGAAPPMKPPIRGSVDSDSMKRRRVNMSAPGSGLAHGDHGHTNALGGLRLHLDGDARRRIGREGFGEDGVHLRQIGDVAQIDRDQR